MLAYVLRRLGLAVAVALTVSIVSFALLHFSGDLATSIAGPEASAAQVDALRIQYGLNRPITSQYIDWLWHAAHLDFGR
jgi:ABC-type dipeptide/oligopeptide/nickel transport system permease component